MRIATITQACSGEAPSAHSPKQYTSTVYSRRGANLHLGVSLIASTATALLPLSAPPPAQASLLRFPADSLQNRYILVRAGESESEAENRVLTNPVAKTSMSNALSKNGRRQVVQETFAALNDINACENGCWLWPSTTQNSYQTAEILASLYGIGRNRIVPEFSKIDARGLGGLDGGQWSIVSEEVAAGDASSVDWKPPPGTTGTPNESATEVLVRGRELLSLLETQFFGETVLIISPDSDNLSILQAGVLGIDLRGHRKFAVLPGHVRQLEISTVERDDSPRQIPCPHPPQCR
jgi:broad specificity phosphatase PhoE